MSDLAKAAQTGAFLSKLAGYIFPGASSFADVVQAISDRNRDRRLARLESFVRALQTDRLDAADASAVPPDLFDEIASAAVQDEDNTKTPYYAALIEFVAKESPQPYVVRLFISAMRALTVYELSALAGYIETGRPPSDLPHLLPQAAFWQRLAANGLFDGGTMIHRNNITPMGQKLAKIIASAGLAAASR